MMDRFVVMSVSGCGKSSIGAAFAAQIGARFVDADDLHPQSNIAKMAAGNALTDDDRRPWLEIVERSFAQAEGPLVIACSALKRSYRDIIRETAAAPVAHLHLDGARDVIAQRMAAGQDHIMPTTLLDSQFAALEPLGTDEVGTRVDIDQVPDASVAELVAHFREDRT
ncbi:gluconokinase [Primorskyibacter flagellatus]|uniref:gluconokinase n=1 Tax=Primorskyibacter flagellatus TaxID=1387277 RepID=UPI003A91F369